MADVSTWSTTPGSNNSSPPDGWPEGQSAPSVNDCARQMMAELAEWYLDTKGSLTSTGSANAYVLATNTVHATLAAQSLLAFRANFGNTGAATLAVDGLVAKSLRIRGAALASGDIVSGSVVLVSYNATDDVYDCHVSLPRTTSATDLSSGTLADARLSSQVVLKDGAISSVDNLDAADPGYRGVPDNAQAGNYTLVLADAGFHILHASGAGAGDTYTIPANASVAYDLGTVLTFINADSNSVSIAITSDTMTLAGTTTTGTRTLGQNGIATAIKMTSTTWLISGTNLS